MSVTPLEALPLELLRQRTSAKWTTYGSDVIPLFVAETDYPLAPAISRELSRAIELGDTGYTSPAPGIAEAYADFARRRLGWTLDPSHVSWTADVIMGVVEILRRLIAPGERVVVMPPVYPPFYDTVQEAGGIVERVPLARTATGWQLDLAGIDAALAGGARAILLCNPHNPTGTTHSLASLRGLAEVAERHGVPVISDEIHAPLTHAPAVFTPFLAASDAARSIGYTVTSVSKTFNLAGLKCAVMIGGSARQVDLLRRLPLEVGWRTGHLGAIAHVAACAPESDAWVDALLAALAENRRLLTELLSEHLPLARYIEPDAGYLAWVDVSAYGWGGNPAKVILRDAKVALHHGPLFGDEGAGHVRINVGCAPELLRDAVERMGAMVGS